jgi:tRNA(fMet)-specific endonuclease VapC
MFVLDTDTLTLLLLGRARVTARRELASEEVAITVITRIEVLQGRFSSVLKAENGGKLLLAQQRLTENERDLEPFLVLPLETASVTEFDRLRMDKKLKKIGRADLLIASIVLANRATLVTRNLKHFRSVSGLPVENWDS